VDRINSQWLVRVSANGRDLGFVAIDSLVAGSACGGLRMLPDVNEAELRILARAMTLKYGLLGFPQGGAKAGVKGDPEAPAGQRLDLLRQFGVAIAPLLKTKTYVPGPDMGTDNVAVRHMLECAGAPAAARELRGEQSGFYTALGVFIAARRAIWHQGLSLADCTAAIEGFGKVGSALAGLLGKAGVRVLAVSSSRGALYSGGGLDVPRLQSLASRHGSEFITAYAGAERLANADLLELPIDLLLPCAHHYSIHAGNVARLRARLICPGANAPVAEGAEEILTARGVLCVPDFVANCGGVLGGTMEFASVPRAAIEAFMNRRLARGIDWLLQQAAAQKLSLRELATEVALKRHARVRAEQESGGFKERLFRAGLGFYRRGWVPPALVGSLAMRYFERSVFDWSSACISRLER